MRVLDLFGGAGGVACALESLGVRHVSVELWDRAAAVARAAGHIVVEADVRNPSALAVAVGALHGPPDLVWASPPCQAWSSAGKRRGAQDDRNGWPWTFDALELLGLPPVIAENVPGMLHHTAAGHPDPKRCPGCYLDCVVLPWLRERYSYVGVRTLDAADYGVPQHRRRLIIQASHDPMRWPERTHGPPGGLFTRQPWISAGKALGLTVSQRPRAGAPFRDVTAGPAPTVLAKKGTDPAWRVIGGGARGATGGLDTWRPRDATDEPSPTVTGFGGTGALHLRNEQTGAASRPAPGITGGGTFTIYDGNPGPSAGATDRTLPGRRLAPAECAALQAFPADYPWHAAGTQSAAYQAIGNAVPPPLARAIVGAALRLETRRGGI